MTQSYLNVMFVSIKLIFKKKVWHLKSVGGKSYFRIVD
jgi:hypothetical protein